MLTSFSEISLLNGEDSTEWSDFRFLRAICFAINNTTKIWKRPFLKKFNFGWALAPYEIVYDFW